MNNNDCEICGDPLVGGYVEMMAIFQDGRKRMCFECARKELMARRALEGGQDEETNQ